MGPAGLVTDGFAHAPYSDQVWNPPHLPRLLERAGYAREFPMAQFEISLPDVDLDSFLTPAYHALRADTSFTWGHIEVRDLKRLLPEICDAFNEGFDQNPMFVPLTHEEFNFQAKDL